MELKQIFTRRSIKGQNYAQPIIYEWEDVIAEKMSIPVKSYSSLYRIIDKLGIHSSLFGPSKDTFRFVINGRNYDEPMNNKHIVPCIIDFFEKGEQLNEFYKKHSNNKLVLLSSPFDYQYLKDNECPLNIGLFAYSLSDKYVITDKVKEKKYDIVLTGRQDPLLYSFFKKYVKKHPSVTYVKRGKDLENDSKKAQKYYVNGEECIGAIETREEFMQLQAQGRATLYGVQGYINDERTKGFYHMTPHFLEIIACGCHVLAHYPTGPEGIDPKYYEFDKFSPSIESYDAFEMAMDHALSTDVDLNMYASYMKKHYTSARVMELQKLLVNLD